ncbi:SDR family NAD(P)-dependent oxidoreductase [Kordiimonas sp. SCSIO 12610]|uniref:SDR family NAD(P)-dependent oxidoreductase n=1 Tax=Kordiimonas sp. SCSIO 12610 TaxID=2829597 RepID=UPI00210F0BC7|nr:SDR family oxidoreductase [Kordiimonas sp. SCSIO 12610]UTW56782.1 SDR family oxidoreductase [Kordiimonas sp. SCSIO 12610]
MDLGLKEKRVLITGGTRGIGASIVDTLLDEGASVAYCARNSDEIATTLAVYKAKGANVWAKACDVGNPAEYQAWLAEAVSALGGADIFIPNVSAGANAGEEGWQAAFNVDLMATVRGCEAMLGELVKGVDPSIVVITSIAGLEIMGEPGPYNTIKAGLITYASQLGDIAAQHGIRVNCVSPGPIHVDDGFWGKVQSAQPGTYNQVAERHPMNRLGTTAEVAKTVAFLVSPAASWITRTNVIVDGGFSRRIQF